MKNAFLIVTIAALQFGCATAEVTDNSIQSAAKALDYGDYSSATLVEKAWKASAKKSYPELFAYTQKCVELHGEEGKRMNAELTDFEPEPTAAQKWALNDVGTCLFIMAEAYLELKEYPEAVAAYQSLATDYNYAQCWDTKGWFWRPADTAAWKANKYKNYQ